MHFFIAAQRGFFTCGQIAGCGPIDFAACAIQHVDPTVGTDGWLTVFVAGDEDFGVSQTPRYPWHAAHPSRHRVAWQEPPALATDRFALANLRIP